MIFYYVASSDFVFIQILIFDQLKSYALFFADYYGFQVRQNIKKLNKF